MAHHAGGVVYAPADIRQAWIGVLARHEQVRDGGKGAAVRIWRAGKAGLQLGVLRGEKTRGRMSPNRTTNKRIE